MYAVDIESCVDCAMLVFPGDEIYVEKGELRHAFHVENSDLPFPREPIFL